MATPQAGQIWGNYQLKRFIAKGGFGWVFAAEHKWLKSQVAIKILDTNPYRLQKDIEQFLAEAQKLQAMKHPNIVEVKDFGIAHDMPYLVMPLYQASLSSMRGRILPLSTIIVYVKQIAAALNFVHQYQIVHRDIKPENFLLGNDGEIILSDFGIAIITHSVKSNQEYAGTAPYMPPEQWRAKAVRASDQYALAIVVYQWLCGELPFHGTALEVMGQHINLQPPSLREKNPTISQDVESVVMKALAKDPAQRFHTILEFAEALEKAAKSLRLELLLTLPIPEREGIRNVQWVWGNHYLFIVYGSWEMHMIDVLTGNTVFSSSMFKDYPYDDDWISVSWDRENCIASFPEGTISLTGSSFLDTRTKKYIGGIYIGDIVPLDAENSKHEGFEAFSRSPEGRKIITLADSLRKSDRRWRDFDTVMQEAQRERIGYSFRINSITESGISFCPPRWQFVALARVNEQQRIHRIEAYQVIGQ